MSALDKAAADDVLLARARRHAQFQRFSKESPDALAKNISSELRTFLIKQHSKLRHQFASFDENHDGTLSHKEMVVGLRSIDPAGKHWTTEQLGLAIAVFDKDDSGYIDYHEFCHEFHVPEPPDGSVPRLLAAAATGDAPRLKLELERQADVNARHSTSWRGRTALMTAAYAGHCATLAPLLLAGGEVDARDSAGWTAVMFAAAAGHADAARLLCRNGADCDLLNDDGQSAMQLARGYGHTSVLEALAVYTGLDRRGIPIRLWRSPGKH